MEISLRGRNVTLTDAVQDAVHRKVTRLGRYLDRIRDVHVRIAREDTRSAEDCFKVEVTVNADGALLRCEERGPTIAAALDRVVDVLRGKIVRYKERLQAKPRVAALEAEPTTAEPAEPPERIVRVKRLVVKPISAEEAVEQMEQLGHDFFVFINAADERVNVLYRRRDGAYGLIVPEEG